LSGYVLTTKLMVGNRQRFRKILWQVLRTSPLPVVTFACRQTLGHVEWQAQHEAGLRLRGDFEATATPVTSR